MLCDVDSEIALLHTKTPFRVDDWMIAEIFILNDDQGSEYYLMNRAWNCEKAEYLQLRTDNAKENNL